MYRALSIIAFAAILSFAILFIGLSKGFKYLSPRFDPCPDDSSGKTIIETTEKNSSGKSIEDSKEATRKDTNDVVFKALEDNYARYFDNIFKVVGFIIVATGWILTSDKSRESLQNNIVAHRITLGATFIIAC